MLIYIHGFNSSPASHKANLLLMRLQHEGRQNEFRCPALSHWPDEAMATLKREVERAGVENVTLVGSSLGGFYAAALVERTGCRAVLVNPAITPHEGLRAHLGQQKNLYTHEEYTLTETHLAQLRAMNVAHITRRENYFLIHTTGDELLDWRIAVARFNGCRQIIVDGSDHGFAEFGDYIDTVLEFARV